MPALPRTSSSSSKNFNVKTMTSSKPSPKSNISSPDPRPLLEALVKQFVKKHLRAPTKLTLTPEAALLLSLKGRVPKKVSNVTVECAQFTSSEIERGLGGKGRYLGVFFHPVSSAIRSVDLG
jgi:hypothetical protein